MSSIKKKPTSKNYSHYVLTKGFHTGVFVKWASVKRVTDGHEWPCYKGFYTLEEALYYARENIGPNYYEEHGPPVELMTANHELENQLQEEELQKLRELVSILEEKATSRIHEIQKLQEEIAAKEEDLSQLMQINHDYLSRIA